MSKADERLKELFDGKYAVSDTGDVYSLWFINNKTNKKRLIPKRLKSKLRSGYPSVSIRVGGQTRTESIHELVLRAFVGPRPEGFVAGHKNGIPTDNRVENLYWITPRQNQLDRRRHGTATAFEKNPAAKLNREQVRTIRLLHKKGNAK